MIKKIRDILQSGICLSDFTDKCKNDGACRKCEDEALEKLIAEHDRQIIADVIEEIHTELIAEIAMLNETDMSQTNLYTFACRIKEITEKLMEKIE